MRTYKCDRCGTLFERYEGQATSNFFIMASNPHCLDLCPDCNTKLQERVSDGKDQVFCNHTDAEIAESFIEDVKAVKDLLPRAESEGEK